MSDHDQKEFYELQQELVRFWDERKMSKDYKNTFLSFLDSISYEQALEKITTQIRRLTTNKKIYQTINSYLYQQKKQNNILKEKLTQKQSQRSLVDICSHLDELRKYKLQIAQNILSLSEKQDDSIDPIIGFCPLFIQLHQSNDFIRQSFLRNFIKFRQSQFNPFFLQQYAFYQKEKNKLQNEHIQSLFNVNFSYSYRLIKTQKLMVSYIKSYEEIEQKIPKNVLTKREKVSRHTTEGRQNKKKVNTQRQEKLPEIKKIKHFNDSEFEGNSEVKTIRHNLLINPSYETRSEAEKKNKYFDQDSEREKKLRLKRNLFKLKEPIQRRESTPNYKVFEGDLNQSKQKSERKILVTQPLQNLKKIKLPRHQTEMNGDDDKLNKLTSPIQKVQRRKLKQTKWNNIKFKGMNDSQIGFETQESSFQRDQEVKTFKRKEKKKLSLNPIVMENNPSPTYKIRSLKKEKPSMNTNPDLRQDEQKNGRQRLFSFSQQYEQNGLYKKPLRKTKNYSKGSPLRRALKSQHRQQSYDNEQQNEGLERQTENPHPEKSFRKSIQKNVKHKTEGAQNQRQIKYNNQHQGREQLSPSYKHHRRYKQPQSQQSYQYEEPQQETNNKNYKQLAPKKKSFNLPQPKLQTSPVPRSHHTNQQPQHAYKHDVYNDRKHANSQYSSQIQEQSQESQSSQQQSKQYSSSYINKSRLENIQNNEQKAYRISKKEGQSKQNDHNVKAQNNYQNYPTTKHKQQQIRYPNDEDSKQPYPSHSSNNNPHAYQNLQSQKSFKESSNKLSNPNNKGQPSYDPHENKNQSQGYKNRQYHPQTITTKDHQQKEQKDKEHMKDYNRQGKQANNNGNTYHQHNAQNNINRSPSSNYNRKNGSQEQGHMDSHHNQSQSLLQSQQSQTNRTIRKHPNQSNDQQHHKNKQQAQSSSSRPNQSNQNNKNHYQHQAQSPTFKTNHNQKYQQSSQEGNKDKQQQRVRKLSNQMSQIPKTKPQQQKGHQLKQTKPQREQPFKGIEKQQQKVSNTNKSVPSQQVKEKEAQKGKSMPIPITRQKTQTNNNNNNNDNDKNTNMEETSQNRENKQKTRKQIKMKPATINITQFPQYSQQYGFNQQCINTNYNNYVTQFYIGDEVGVIAICKADICDQYHILLWHTISHIVNSQMSYLLFKKYIEYVQKYTNLQYLYVHDVKVDTQKLGFSVLDGRRKRVSQMSVQQTDFPNFFYFQCSNICFQQNDENKMLYSDQIQAFKEDNAVVAQDIGLVNNRTYNNEHMIIVNNVSNGLAMNKILNDKVFDTYELQKQLPINKLDMFMFKDILKANHEFMTQNGYMIMNASIMYQQGQSVLAQLQLKEKGYTIVVGKNIKGIQEQVTIINEHHTSTSSKHKQKQKIGLKMFYKQLYGRIQRGNLGEKGCYGNWQISFVWQEYLRGKIRYHQLQQLMRFGQEQFFLSILYENEHLYSFKVTKDDTL